MVGGGRSIKPSFAIGRTPLNPTATPPSKPALQWSDPYGATPSPDSGVDNDARTARSGSTVSANPTPADPIIRAVLTPPLVRTISVTASMSEGPSPMARVAGLVL